MMSNSFRFKKGDLEIEFSGEKHFVEEQISNWKLFIEDKISDSEVFPPKIQENVSSDNLSKNLEIKVKKNITIDDFLKLKEPDNEVDKTIVAAYYLEKYDKLNSFTEIDLYRLLKIENIAHYLLINQEKGFLCTSKSDTNLATYSLTFSGEVYVKEGLQ